MISFAKPLLTEDFHNSAKVRIAISSLDERPSIFIRDKPSFSS
jgi:hypothetical protein